MIKVTVTITVPRSGDLDNPGQQVNEREFDNVKEAEAAFDRATAALADPFFKGFHPTS
jgi:hypothetical protein